MVQTTWLTGRPNSSDSATLCGNMQTLAMFASTVASISVDDDQPSRSCPGSAAPAGVAAPRAAASAP